MELGGDQIRGGFFRRVACTGVGLGIAEVSHEEQQRRARSRVLQVGARAGPFVISE